MKWFYGASVVAKGDEKLTIGADLVRAPDKAAAEVLCHQRTVADYPLKDGFAVQFVCMFEIKPEVFREMAKDYE